MATVLPQPTRVSKQKNHSLKLDMTPLVDLGFILITFFIFTATLSVPAVTRLMMPKNGEPSPVAESNSLTFLLLKDKVFAYEGRWKEATVQNQVISTTYNFQKGMGALIQQKKRTAKENLVVLLKPLAGSTYQNVITALDDVQISGVKKYAITEPTLHEIAFALNQ